jgi:hypothetical protein
MLDRPSLRQQYLAEVVGALEDYVGEGEPLHIESEREDDRLRILLTLDSAERFHRLLSREMTRSRGEMDQAP